MGILCVHLTGELATVLDSEVRCRKMLFPRERNFTTLVHAFLLANKLKIY